MLAQADDLGSEITRTNLAEEKAACSHPVCSSPPAAAHQILIIVMMMMEGPLWVGEPPFCNGSRRLSTWPKEAERWRGPQGKRRGGGEGGKEQPQTPGGEEGAPARPTERQKVLRKKMGAVERISELNET